jgi:AcrR family transcriptional regulator
MSMSSHPSVSPRRIPQQKRGRRRVAGFIRAAAAVFAEKGYEGATMNAIAERAHSCIGSLYQFFPNKLALAEAIRDQYSKGIEQSWVALGRKAGDLSPEQLACKLVTLQLEIVKEHPALLALLDMPPTSRTRTWRELIRARIAAVLVSHKPRMHKVSALRTALVVQQISRGLLTIYAKADATEKAAIIEEFKAALSGYLVPKLKQ